MMGLIPLGYNSPGRLGRYARRVRRECRLSLPGILFQGESAHLAVAEHDLQLAEHHIPILAPGVPMLDDTLRCQIQHPTQRIVIGERRFVLCNLPELPVQTFDNICRIYDFPNLGRVFKESAQNFPVVLPALDAGGILLSPGVGENAQIILSLLNRHGGIDLLQVSNQFLDVLVADIFGGTADLVDDAAL